MSAKPWSFPRITVNYRELPGITVNYRGNYRKLPGITRNYHKLLGNPGKLTVNGDGNLRLFTEIHRDSGHEGLQ